MRGVSSDKRVDIGLSLLLLFLGGLIVLGQANPLATQMGRDSGVFAYIASHLLQGRTPYLFAWDHKPPMIYFINALALLLGRGTRWGIWGVEFASLMGAMLVALATLRRRFGLLPALFGCGTLLLCLNRLLFGGNFTEEYALLFSFLSLWLFSRLLQRTDTPWTHFGLGLAFAFNFLLRPNNTGVQLAVFLTEALLVFPTMVPLRVLKAIAMTALGFMLPLAATCTFFWSRGALGELVGASLIYNLAYSSRVDVPGALLRGASALAFGTLVFGAGVLVAIRRLWSQRQSRRPDAWIVWLLIDLVLEVLLSSLSGRNFVHYFICWLPALAVAAAVLASEVLTIPRPSLEKHVSAMLITGIVVVSALSWKPLVAYAASFQRIVTARALLTRSNAVIEYVNSQTEPADTVFVWGGEAGINFLAHRDAPTAQILYGKFVASPLTESLSLQFVREIEKRPPALIIDRGLETLVPLDAPDPIAWSESHGLYVQPHIREFFDFLHDNYTYSAEVSGMRIYARRVP